MCGICGFFSKNRITQQQLTEMNDTMYHRGPDDNGAEIYSAENGYAVGMAQRRLSIVDISSMGHQPMHSPDQRVSIVFNGEIYDFHKLKEYMDTLDTVHSECQYYIAAITLGEFDRANWLDGRSKWAKGKVAELIAYEPNGVIDFQVIPHNE